MLLLLFQAGTDGVKPYHPTSLCDYEFKSLCDKEPLSDVRTESANPTFLINFGDLLLLPLLRICSTTLSSVSITI
tara:strand:+ start:500 stop:724 length:225 start_codon:yes stop_codon:yes gene_type:complete